MSTLYIHVQFLTSSLFFNFQFKAPHSGDMSLKALSILLGFDKNNLSISYGFCFHLIFTLYKILAKKENSYGS